MTDYVIGFTNEYSVNAITFNVMNLYYYGVIGFFITGLSFGGISALLRLPIPAPNTFAGLLGIIGLFVGYMLTQRFFIPS